MASPSIAVASPENDGTDILSTCHTAGNHLKKVSDSLEFLFSSRCKMIGSLQKALIKENLCLSSTQGITFSVCFL